MLSDLTKCIGCGLCQQACQEWNHLSANEEGTTGKARQDTCLSAETWTLPELREVERDGKLERVFVKRQCMHCVEPACVSAYSVGALQKQEDGAVTYDCSRCLGCRYCMVACPFGVPKLEWEEAFPRIRKCTFCVDRQADGMEPACAAACPTGALTFGDRDGLIAEAEARIQAAPDRYFPHIYGQGEIGGTSWMYLSPVPFEELGFPVLKTEPVTRLSEEVATYGTAGVAAIGAGVLLFALAVRFLPILPEGKRDQAGTMPSGWSRWAVVFVGGALSLLTITVVFLLLPTTQATASKVPAAMPSKAANMPPTPGEYSVGSCQSCHLDSQALLDAGADTDRLAAMVVDPQPADSPHGRLDCIVCHYGNKNAHDKREAHSGRILDPTIGEAAVCLACHRDLPDEFPDDRLRTPHDEVTHGQMVDVFCSDCHGGVGHGFDPVSGEVICPMSVCLDCHVSRQLDATLTDCAACHIGSHEPVATLACGDCHQSTDVWQGLEAEGHPLELVGRHAQVGCLDCHRAAERDLQSECVACHQPPGEGHYGTDCQECHMPTSFEEACLPEHPLALVGAHQGAACAGCHVQGEESPEYVCSNCHGRPEGHLPGNCDVCHTPAGWAKSI